MDRNPDKRFQNVSELKDVIEKELGKTLLDQTSLASVLKASQLVTEPQQGNEAISVNALLARAQKISGKLSVPLANRINRPYILLAASVVICIVLLLWSGSAEDNIEPAEETLIMTDRDIQPEIVTVVSGTGAFDETPNQMYNRITEQSDRTPVTQSAKKIVPAPSGKTSVRTRPEIQEKQDSPAVITESLKEKREPVDVPAGKEISVTLREDISSEETERDGKIIPLICNENVLAGDRIIIRKGASVLGKIVDVVPSSSKKKKALVGFVIQQVQAADGSMIKLHSKRFRLYADEPGVPVIYKKGQSFNAELKRGRVR